MITTNKDKHRTLTERLEAVSVITVEPGFLGGVYDFCGANARHFGRYTYEMLCLTTRDRVSSAVGTSKNACQGVCTQIGLERRTSLERKLQTERNASRWELCSELRCSN